MNRLRVETFGLMRQGNVAALEELRNHPRPCLDSLVIWQFGLTAVGNLHHETWCALTLIYWLLDSTWFPSKIFQVHPPKPCRPLDPLVCRRRQSLHFGSVRLWRAAASGGCKSPGHPAIDDHSLISKKKHRQFTRTIQKWRLKVQRVQRLSENNGNQS
jgi:hypothetical protein